MRSKSDSLRGSLEHRRRAKARSVFMRSNRTSHRTFVFHGHRTRTFPPAVEGAPLVVFGASCVRLEIRPHRDEGGHTTASTTPTNRPLLMGPNCRLSKLLARLSPGMHHATKGTRDRVSPGKKVRSRYQPDAPKIQGLVRTFDVEKVGRDDGGGRVPSSGRCRRHPFRTGRELEQLAANGHNTLDCQRTGTVRQRVLVNDDVARERRRRGVVQSRHRCIRNDARHHLVLHKAGSVHRVQRSLLLLPLVGSLTSSGVVHLIIVVLDRIAAASITIANKWQ
jgi:hypothetical protein